MANLEITLFRRYLLYLRFWGLYFDLKGWHGWRLFSAFVVILNTSALLFLIGYAGLYFDPVSNFSNSFMLLINIFWLGQCSTSAIYCYRLSVNGRVDKFFLYDWPTVFRDCQNRQSAQDFAIKSQRIVIFIVASFHFANTLVLVLGAFEISPFYVVYSFKNHWPPEFEGFVVTIGGFICSFCMSTWILPFGLYVLIGLNINKLFDIYNQDLRRRLENSCAVSVDDLKYLDELHLKISKLVFDMNDSFSLFVFITFILDLALLLANTYYLVHSGSEGELLFAVSIWIMTILFIVGSISITSSRTMDLVKANAHQCVNDLYSIPTCIYSQRKLMQLNIFIGRLTTGPPIAISGCGFFTLSKDFIKTFVGAYLTYYLLLLELKKNGSIGDA